MMGSQANIDNIRRDMWGALKAENKNQTEDKGKGRH